MVHYIATIWSLPSTLAAAGGGGGANDQWSILVPLLIMGALFYFMFIVPERKKQRQTKDMLAALKKNDRVVTAGGLYGTVVNIPPNTGDVVLRVDENNNTRIRVLRSSILRVIGDGEGEQAEGS